MVDAVVGAMRFVVASPHSSERDKRRILDISFLPESTPTPSHFLNHPSPLLESANLNLPTILYHESLYMQVLRNGSIAWHKVRESLVAAAGDVEEDAGGAE